MPSIQRQLDSIDEEYHDLSKHHSAGRVNNDLLDDSDDEDPVGVNVRNKDDILDFLNNDNEDDDDFDSEFHTVHQSADQKRNNVKRIHEKARQVTHKVVDGIFDKIMKGVVDSMKYQA